VEADKEDEEETAIGTEETEGREEERAIEVLEEAVDEEEEAAVPPISRRAASSCDAKSETTVAVSIELLGDRVCS